jgi:hypothetical protein
MRSRKVSPGLVVTRTISQSESTRVPPVTALRSPPLSRITGALSPVIALSSTDATPSSTSPSLGITSPASTNTRSPLRSRAESTGCAFELRAGVSSRLAGTSWRALRRVSACALPRPSAMASAKLANSTVIHSQADTPRMKPAGASPRPVMIACKKSTLLKALPTSTTNMTGFFSMRRGSSFLNASSSARRTIGPSNRGRASLGAKLRVALSCACVSTLAGACSAALAVLMLDMGVTEPSAGGVRRWVRARVQGRR